MPTWCHMFNSTWTGNAGVWFDDLPPESIDSYDDLKKAFLENYLQQKKYINDPIELHNNKQRDGESMEDFVRRYKLESRDVKGAPECMRVSGFVHGITNPELIKRIHDKILKTVDEMMRVTTSFLGERDRRKLKAGKLSHLIKELKQNKGNEQPKVANKGETSGKDKALAIIMTKMPFSLRNAGATYQRLVDKAFHKQIGRNLEVYMDDLIIKVHREDEIFRDVKGTFKTLREINMKLNPKKYAFGVEEGMFLGYKVNANGLKVSPDKVDAVLSLPSPKCLDAQKLNGKLASLDRELKGPELNYTSIEKLVLALVHASKRLKGWFRSRTNPHKPRRDGVHLCSKANVDSRLVTNQVNGAYVAKEADMIRYLEKVKALTGSFKAFSIKQIPRSENKKADSLSKIAFTSFVHLSKQVLVEELKEKSISEVEILVVVEEEGVTWMTPLFKYLMEETLPADVKKARAIKRKSWRFAIVNETRYKKSFLGPWLRCVGPLQANYVLSEIHEGSCIMHVGTRSVVAKALQTGYYWPTMHKDATTLIKAWKVKFLIVAMDYFTKCIEAKPVVTITGNQIKKFVCDNIVCRFGLPGEIISDNEKQFQDDSFKDWCEKLCIRQHFASVKHPQTNGLVERANRSLGEGIKARLEARSKNWMEELPHILWAHRTMIKSSNGDIPFLLTYGTEAVILAEIGMRTLRTTKLDLVGNNEALEINLDLLEERRQEAAIREAKRKVGPKWEGPYEVMEALRKGAYKLRDRDGKHLPRTWNINNLKKCYIHKM
nr:protein NYNRIN-like [Tanacetum cinerariifolium]